MSRTDGPGARGQACLAVGGDRPDREQAGMTAETLRRRVRQAERDTGHRSGLTTDVRAPTPS